MKHDTRYSTNGQAQKMDLVLDTIITKGDPPV